MPRIVRRIVCFAAFLFVLGGAKAARAQPAWTNGATCYEVFVRSFYDSNGDGIGDIND